MLLVPSATGAERPTTGADDLLRSLAALLPDFWIMAGDVASKPVSDSCSRGRTRPFDAIIIGSRMIFVLDIWSQRGLVATRQKSALFSSRPDPSHFNEASWLNFRREVEKLKALLHDRFEVEPGRVVPDKIWGGSHGFDTAVAGALETVDLRSFARAATRRDHGSSFPPLRAVVIDRIATFLTQETQAPPDPVLFFSDEGARRAGQSQAPEKHVARLEGPAPAPAPSPDPACVEATLPHPAPRKPAEDPSPPIPATMSSPASGLPDAAGATHAGRSTRADASVERAASTRAVAPGPPRPTVHRTWLAALLMLLVVSQAGTIAWLALSDRRSGYSQPPVIAAKTAPAPAPILIRSLPKSEPMQIRSEHTALRAGPGPEFAAVGELHAGTDVMAGATALGSGGGSWVEIRAASGLVGFVPEGTVGRSPQPSVAVQQVAPPAPATKPAIKPAAEASRIDRAAAPVPGAKAKPVVAEPASQIARAAAPAPAGKVASIAASPPLPRARRDTGPAQRLRPVAAPPRASVACILPGGGEIRTTRSGCRAQSGLIYQ